MEHAGAAVPLMVLATFEAMLGESAAALRHADRALELRVASDDAVLGGVLRGACLIRREPGRLLVLALVGAEADERFFAELADVIHKPSSVDPVVLQRDPAFRRVQTAARLGALLTQARLPIKPRAVRAGA